MYVSIIKNIVLAIIFTLFISTQYQYINNEKDIIFPILIISFILVVFLYWKIIIKFLNFISKNKDKHLIQNITKTKMLDVIIKEMNAFKIYTTLFFITFILSLITKNNLFIFINFPIIFLLILTSFDLYSKFSKLKKHIN